MAKKLSGEKRVLFAVRRACDWSERRVHADSKRHLAALATIAATAPFVGLLGTVMGIMSAMHVSNKIAPALLLKYQSAGICEALLTTALGLVTAVPAVWGYNYFTRRVATLDLEAATVSRILVNDVALSLASGRDARRRA
ncbi:MAG: MotA/TolQ/ExbB proton channel family protein [Candidatus Acidiferrales bacterium]